MIPRPVVIIVVLVLLTYLGADIGGQFVIPGHTANPVIDGGIIALIGAIVTGVKGPKPSDPASPEDPAPDPVPEFPSATAPLPAADRPDVGRHHRSRSEGPP
jgi:hypothetical protein